MKIWLETFFKDSGKDKEIFSMKSCGILDHFRRFSTHPEKINNRKFWVFGDRIKKANEKLSYWSENLTQWSFCNALAATILISEEKKFGAFSNLRKKTSQLTPKCFYAGMVHKLLTLQPLQRLTFQCFNFRDIFCEQKTNRYAERFLIIMFRCQL